MPFLIKKTNGKLIFINGTGYETRNESTFWCIQEADKIYKWPDFSDILISSNDYEENLNEYTYSKQNRFYRLVPDFNFHSWPQALIYDYEVCIKEIDDNGKLKPLKNKVGWIGNCNTNILRVHMMNVSKYRLDLFDFFHMTWISSGKPSIYLSLPDLVKTYSILIDIEGNGYSGRLKYLLWSHRPLLLVDRPHKEYFFEHLQEWVHYIPVKRDLSDLIEKTIWCIENYDKANIIAENAYKFSKKYLTRDYCYKVWNDVITDHIND